MKKEQQEMLKFLSKIIWCKYDELDVKNSEEMEALLVEANAQGLLPLILNNIEDYNLKHPDNKIALPGTLKDTSKFIILNSVSKFYKILAKQQKLVGILEKNNIPYCFMKGTTVAVNYPKPDIRRMGDIDVFVSPNRFNEACELLLNEGYTAHGTYSEYHTAFFDEDIEIEVHNAFAGLPVGKTRNSLMFLIDACSNSKTFELNGREFKGPNTIDNAVIQLLHVIHHITEHGVGIRQLCDWMFFVNQNIDDTVWARDIYPVLKKAKLDMFAKTITMTCHEYLGLNNPDITWYKDADKEKCHNFMEYIFDSGNLGAKNKEGTGKKRDYIAQNLWDYQRERKINYSLELGIRTIKKIFTGKKSLKNVCTRVNDIETIRKRLVYLGVFSFKDSKDYAMQ